eukprot:11995021-Alexandrium_andersonii.AAC.1
MAPPAPALLGRRQVPWKHCATPSALRAAAGKGVNHIRAPSSPLALPWDAPPEASPQAAAGAELSRRH